MSGRVAVAVSSKGSVVLGRVWGGGGRGAAENKLGRGTLSPVMTLHYITLLARKKSLFWRAMRDLGGSRASQRPRHSARPGDERASPTRAIELGPYRDYFRRVSLHVTPCTQSWSGHSVLYDILHFLAPAAGMGAAGGPSSARASPTDRQCPTPTQSNMGAASAQGCLNISGVCSTSNEEASSTPGPPTFWQREPLSHGRVVAALASFREPQSIRCLVSDPKVLGSEAEGRVPIAVLVLPPSRGVLESVIREPLVPVVRWRGRRGGVPRQQVHADEKHVAALVADVLLHLWGVHREGVGNTYRRCGEYI